MTNTGSGDLTIEKLSPGVLQTHRGTFDFSALTKDGPVVIRSGKSIRVDIQRKVSREYPLGVSADIEPVLKPALSRLVSVDSQQGVATGFNVLVGNSYIV